MPVEARSGDVPLKVCAATALGVHQIEAAIEDGGIGFAHQLAKGGGVD